MSLNYISVPKSELRNVCVSLCSGLTSIAYKMMMSSSWLSLHIGSICFCRSNRQYSCCKWNCDTQCNLSKRAYCRCSRTESDTVGIHLAVTRMRTSCKRCKSIWSTCLFSGFFREGNGLAFWDQLLLFGFPSRTLLSPSADIESDRESTSRCEWSSCGSKDTLS